MGYRKHYNGHCHQCDEFSKLVLIEKDEEQEIFRLRCSQCFALNEFPLERVLKTGRLLTEKEFENREEALSEVQDYNPKKSYWRGQKIRHPVFDEVGKVVAKGETVDDNKIITVNFEKSGKKKLVEDLKIL
ncbi:MAG: hypothetical protein ACE5HI_10635 [bacterium]